MRVALVTGIEGFTGRYLATNLLSSGYSVVGVALKPSRIDGVSTTICDITDVVALTSLVTKVSPDVVIHLAGISNPATADSDLLFRTNVEGTRCLLEALSCCRSAPRVVLLASSASVYGSVGAGQLDESFHPQPANDYARSKLEMEIMASQWLDRLPIMFVRPFNYTGVGQSESFLIPKIVSHFASRSPLIELGNVDVVRDFSDVRQVVEWYKKLIEAAFMQDLRGEVFNTCSGTGYSLHEVLQIMGAISGHKLDVHINPAFVRPNEVKQLIGSRAKLDRTIGLQQNIVFSGTLSWMYKSAVSALNTSLPPEY